jgi:hypothetical protein
MRRHRTTLAALAVVVLALTAACGSSKKATPPTTSSSTRAPTTSVSSSTASSSTSTIGSTVATVTTVPVAVPYLYVYPFASLAEARAWQRSYESGGHQPWHLDAELTAASFVDFIGGAGQMNQAIRTRYDASGAHVSMGFHNPNGVPVTSGIVHLVRVSTGPDRPWEVVGNDQSPDFTLTTPAYAATVSSPVRVGGRITGVDENIRVRVWQLSSNHPIGDNGGIPAGGMRTPWSTAVSYSGATAAVLVITATTGGHLQQFEQFVFTAVRRGP